MEIETYIKEIRQRAEEALEPLVKKGEGYHNPFEMLCHSQNWYDLIVSAGHLTQPELIEVNKNFDPKSCFGRVALMVLMVERYFPESDVQVADVVIDALAQRMLDLIKTERNPQYRKEMAQEILMYEEPHAVIVVDGVQFDPISVVMGSSIEHPKIKTYDPWGAITATVVVNEALAKPNAVARLIDLQRAELFCPGFRVIEQNEIVAQAMLDEYDVKEACRQFLSEGMNARILYFMWIEYGWRELFDTYPPEIVELLDRELETQVEEVS